MRVIALLALMALPAPLLAADLVAARTLPAGTMITASDLLSPGQEAPTSVQSDPLIGLETRIAIYEGRPVTPNKLRKAVLVARNSIVRVVFQRGALRIVVDGRALDEGSLGDRIRVLNLTSKQTFTAQVQADASLDATP